MQPSGAGLRWRSRGDGIHGAKTLVLGLRRRHLPNEVFSVRGVGNIDWGNFFALLYFSHCRSGLSFVHDGTCGLVSGSLYSLIIPLIRRMVLGSNLGCLMDVHEYISRYQTHLPSLQSAVPGRLRPAPAPNSWCRGCGVKVASHTFDLFLSRPFPVSIDDMAADMELRNIARISEGGEDMVLEPWLLFLRGLSRRGRSLGAGKRPKWASKQGAAAAAAWRTSHQLRAGNSSADMKTRVVPLWFECGARPLKKFPLNASCHVRTRSGRDRGRPALEVFQVDSRPEWYFRSCIQLLVHRKNFPRHQPFALPGDILSVLRQVLSPSPIPRRSIHINQDTASGLVFRALGLSSSALQHFSTPSSIYAGCIAPSHDRPSHPHIGGNNTPTNQTKWPVPPEAPGSDLLSRPRRLPSRTLHACPRLTLGRVVLPRRNLLGKSMLRPRGRGRGR